MKTTSMRLPPTVHEGITEANKPLSEIVRPALVSYLVNRMVGRCVVTGEPLYTFSEFMCVKRGTPLADALGIDKVEQFIISEEPSSTVTEHISTGREEELDVEPEYYNGLGPVIYAAEEQYLSDAHEDHEYWNTWAQTLFKPTMYTGTDTKAMFGRMLNILIWCDQTDPDRESITLQRLWDATPEEVQARLLNERGRSGNGDHYLAEALDKINIDQ